LDAFSDDDEEEANAAPLCIGMSGLDRQVGLTDLLGDPGVACCLGNVELKEGT
jgi:hypothetical protein